MKVLMTVPTFPTVPHVWPKTQASIDAMLAATRHDVEVLYQGEDDPRLTHYENLRNKHNEARAKVLAEGFDALFSVEADMIVPPDALDKLAQVDADIAYGLYCGRTTGTWLLFTQLAETSGRSIVANPEAAKAVLGTIVPSQGAGLGCTLIRRRVLEQIEFRIEKSNNNFADDWYLALDAQAAGLQQAHDTSVICGHIRRDGSVIWPDLLKNSRGRFKPYRIEAKGESMAEESRQYKVRRSLYLGREKRYAKPGETITLPSGEAARLGRFVAEVPQAKPKAEATPEAPKAKAEAKEEAGKE